MSTISSGKKKHSSSNATVGQRLWKIYEAHHKKKHSDIIMFFEQIKTQIEADLTRIAFWGERIFEIEIPDEISGYMERENVSDAQSLTSTFEKLYKWGREEQIKIKLSRGGHHIVVSFSSPNIGGGISDSETEGDDSEYTDDD